MTTIFTNDFETTEAATNFFGKRLRLRQLVAFPLLNNDELWNINDS